MSDKKMIITRTALQLFINKGIHAVGINEVIKQSKVAKKTLYHHFSSKDLLIISTLEYRDQLFMQWLEQRLSQASEAKSAAIELFLALDDWFNNRVTVLGDFNGCFFINACAEYKDPSCAINQCCKMHKANVQNLLGKYVDQFEADKNAAALLTKQLCILKEGAITTALVQRDLAAALKLIEVVKLLVQRH
ncbi:MAG: hypothetical protein OFPI_23250 [Osedax symbiont Rs2]|nr:MAG: hypothetical protein OFPI_23250 [Osedax symbiont Rs2]